MDTVETVASHNQRLTGTVEEFQIFPEVVRVVPGDRLAQAEADIKALAESLQILIDNVKLLKGAYDETIAVMKQLLSRRNG